MITKERIDQKLDLYNYYDRETEDCLPPKIRAAISEWHNPQHCLSLTERIESRKDNQNRLSPALKAIVSNWHNPHPQEASSLIERIEIRKNDPNRLTPELKKIVARWKAMRMGIHVVNS